MKTKTTFLRSSILFAALLMASFSSLASVQIGNLYYNLDDTAKTAEVTYLSLGYTEQQNNYVTGSLTIPSEVSYNGESYSVTSIGSRAFYYCESLTSVTIPDSVTSIGDWGFHGCTSLASVIFPDSMSTIGNNAFYGCTGLTSVAIPSGVSIINDGTFSWCSSLKNITIPESVTSIGQEAFLRCSALTSIAIPDAVNSIGQHAFERCTSLTSVKIPDSVTTISGYTFSVCTSLNSVTLGDSVTSIELFAFEWCTSLASIDIPNSVTSIGQGAFDNCSGLTSIEIPNSVTSMGSSAFFFCSAMKSVVIGNSITKINSSTFKGCSSLTSVTIPSSVTTIDTSAFDCENLNLVVCRATTPPSIQANTFTSSTYTNGELQVPEASISLYKAADSWSSFANIVKMPNPICEQPTIAYEDGALKIESATEGAKCFYTVVAEDTATDKEVENGEVALTGCYQISAYAEAEGYEQSDKTTVSLYFIPDAGTQTDVIDLKDMRGIIVSSAGGIVTVRGLEEHESITVYDLSGVKLNYVTATADGEASFNATPGSIVIVATSNSSIKVLVR